MLCRPQPLTCLACCLLVAVAGCSGGGPTASYESPEACFDGIRTAVSKGDYTTALASVTDETKNAFTAGLVMVGGMMKAFGGMAAAMGGNDPEAQKAIEATKAIDAILVKHGVTDEKMRNALGDSGDMMGVMMGGGPTEEMVAKLSSVVDDKTAFILEMVDALTKLPGGEGPDPQEIIEKLAKSKLIDVKIDGDKATAKIETEGEDPQDVEFRKTAAGWKLHLSLEAMQAAGPGVEPGESDMEMGDGEFDMEFHMDRSDQLGDDAGELDSPGEGVEDFHMEEEAIAD